jgi:sulfite reductase alpha subunit-like flavoprotein
VGTDDFFAFVTISRSCYSTTNPEFHAYAFSRELEKSEGCKCVQDRVWREREIVINSGARGYVCGSSVVVNVVTHVAARIAVEVAAAAAAAGGGKELSYERAVE